MSTPNEQPNQHVKGEAAATRPWEYRVIHLNVNEEINQKLQQEILKRRVKNSRDHLALTSYNASSQPNTVRPLKPHRATILHFNFKTFLMN